MFGRMMVEPVVQVGPSVDLQTAVAALIKVAENVETVRWIELPASVLLFLLVPGDPDSGGPFSSLVFSPVQQRPVILAGAHMRGRISLLFLLG